jgi:predicted phosphodiesterase
VRYLIISDIHANWEALQAVLAATEGEYEQIVNCGDLAGYGPDPNQVIEWCRATNAVIVRGNHDKACAQLDNLEWFNPVARTAALWTFQALTLEHREFLMNLPKGPVVFDDFQVFHGAPQDEDEYVISEPEARQAAQYLDTQVAFFGHTHIQGSFAVHRNGVRRTPEEGFELDDSMKYLVNPGSVGQPRDGDPRAGFAIYDSNERYVECRRVSYDPSLTYRKIVDAGLPEVLGRRLFAGV